jgi:hypothetical protein
VRSPNPQKCALVAASLDIGLLVDTPPTLEGASSSGSSLASTMAFVAACIYEIFCSPSLSTNSGTLSVSIIGLLRHWVPWSKSGRCCPTPHSCFWWCLFEGPGVVLLVLRPASCDVGLLGCVMLQSWICWACVVIWYQWLLLSAVFVYSFTA